MNKKTEKIIITNQLISIGVSVKVLGLIVEDSLKSYHSDNLCRNKLQAVGLQAYIF